MEDDDVKLEEEINIELSRISVTSLEVDDLNTDLSAEAWSDGETTSDELPESVLYCLNVVKNRSQNAENLILQDLEDEETTSDIYRVVSSQASEYLAELASEYNEDPDALKKRILSEIENEELQTRATSDSDSQPINEDITCRVVADERSVTDNGDMTISFTYHEVEERCRQEFELWEERQKELEDQKRKQLKAERELEEKQNEEEKKRRQLYLEEFEAERMKLEMLHKQQQAMMEDELLKEKEVWREKFRQHEELIKRLQLQIEEEKRTFEEQKAKERQHLAEQWNKAAVKIQARFRAFIVYRKYAPILKEWKAEIKRKKELQQKMEREKREKEEKMRRRMQERKQKEEELRKRQEEIERQAHMEQVRRREEYEKKKESLMLEREKSLQLEGPRGQQGAKQKEKIAINAVAENRDKDTQITKEEKERENIKDQREQEKEQKKQILEIREEEEKQEEKHVGKIQEANNSENTKDGKQTSPNSEKKEESHDKSNENEDGYVMTHTGKSSLQTMDLDKNTNTNILDREAVVLVANDAISNKENSKHNSQWNLEAQPDNRNSEHKVQSCKFETIKTAEVVMKKIQEEVAEDWDKSETVIKYFERPLTLPDNVEKKRLTWMTMCKPWSKIYRENQRKKVVKRSRPRKPSDSKMPPLSVEMIIQCGPWNALQQVTTLTLQDLPGCSLSTLSECSSLQLLTLRRCGLTALEGLSNCKGLKYIDVEENNIQTINCENLENLCILILNKNQLASLHGLDGCSDLRNLELSCNKITRIGGLESLKYLQQLIVDHNQLISTKGLCDVPTLMHIDCSFNHLTQLEGIENCGLLQILKLQGNNLSELPTLENHVLLRELYLDDNSISTMETFSLYWLPLLQILSLSQNSLTQLAPLFSCVSLEKLNISNNCLSDLESVIIWFSGCQKLSELSLNGNPVLQEKNWRSSLLKILPILQLLNGENLNSPEKLSTERIKESEPGSFLKFCQAQIEEIDLIKKKTIEQGNASSLDAAQSQCWYFKELMKLSNEHRYAHEYGDLNIADRDEPEAQQDHLKQTATDRLQQNNLFIAGAKENKQGLLNPSERWITTGHIQPMCINSSVPVPQKKSNQEHKIKKKSTECYISHKGESKDNSKISTPTTRNTLRETVIASNEGENLQHVEYSVENLAATLIQSCWRGYIIRRDIHFCARLHTAASEIQCAWRKYLARRNAVCCKKESHELTDAIEQKHKAAALIQAFWKGFLLRKKLASALAAVKSDEVEDDYEEVNVDDFTFDEAALEREWLALDSTRFPSKTLLLTNQLHWPKYARPFSSDHNSFNLPWPPHEAWQCDERPHSLSSENTPFSTRFEKRAMSRLSDLQPKKKLSFKSEKEEKISEEWGFKDTATAQLMLKRAHKMKSKKSSTKNLDPAVRLALFRNNENKHPPVKPPRKRQPAKETASSYFEGREEDFVHLDTTSAEKLQRSKELTYQWLHTQVGDYEATDLRNVKCNRFLPDLDPDILNGGRVQLVASPVSREDTDLDLISMISGSALTQNREKNNQPHRHSAGSSTKDISASERTHLGPFRKERISFRDHPVRLSGGWGSGKKKAKSLMN
ncbi:leucine-rich repeat and IQ domain-containing protein 1 isoform X2 [Mauremys reevesii]|uniref:leucine-rich repeat and IQ domain-containing protein 1 isoform X2 n=1 Tax=Mauremys reevesii TaxID=260615 RepID=UPI00193FCA8A|nr:leucine-rich repeat and IQ domain-containing protein 1 isoform X2 [Mauremys reevesii]